MFRYWFTVLSEHVPDLVDKARTITVLSAISHSLSTSHSFSESNIPLVQNSKELLSYFSFYILANDFYYLFNYLLLLFGNEGTVIDDYGRQ